MAEVMEQNPNKVGISLKPFEGAATAATPVNTAAIELSHAQMQVKDLDSMGRAQIYTVPMPDQEEYVNLTVAQKVWLLKSGPWSKFTVNTVIGGLYLANQLSKQSGAYIDPMQMDVYPTGEGRYGVSNTARWKMAKATGRIRSYEAYFTDLDTTFPTKNGEMQDFSCTVIIEVDGMTKPIKKTQRLSEWYNDTNPNWRNRPEHMLEQNTRGHACELITPTDGDDYAAPVIPAVNSTNIVAAAVQETLGDQENKNS